MIPFYVEFGRGCTIIFAHTIGGARSYAAREFGLSEGPYRARPATEEDLGWVEAMGGGFHRGPTERVVVK